MWSGAIRARCATGRTGRLMRVLCSNALLCSDAPAINTGRPLHSVTVILALEFALGSQCVLLVGDDLGVRPFNWNPASERTRGRHNSASLRPCAGLSSDDEGSKLLPG